MGVSCILIGGVYLFFDVRCSRSLQVPVANILGYTVLTFTHNGPVMLGPEDAWTRWDWDNPWTYAYHRPPF